MPLKPRTDGSFWLLLFHACWVQFMDSFKEHGHLELLKAFGLALRSIAGLSAYKFPPCVSPRERLHYTY